MTPDPNDLVRRISVADARGLVDAARAVLVDARDRRLYDNAHATGLATVRQGPLSSQINQSGTLGYLAHHDGSPYSVVRSPLSIFALPRILALPIE